MRHGPSKHRENSTPPTMNLRQPLIAIPLAVAVVLHSAFNHLLQSPKMATLGIIVVLPPLLHAIFLASERAVGRWLGQGFDADTEMLELINSGRFSDSVGVCRKVARLR